MADCMLYYITFFFYDPATTEIYTYLHTLSLHYALPISFFITARSEFCGKPMIEPGIIVNCYLGMIVQPLVHGLLDVRCYEMIGGRDMQHYRICNSMRFAQ